MVKEVFSIGLSDILNNLENIKDIARDCKEDMWHEENAILEGVFREIADDIEVVISKMETIVDKLESQTLNRG